MKDIRAVGRSENPVRHVKAEKKDSRNGAARKFLGPSYFVTALCNSLQYSDGIFETTIFLIAPSKIDIDIEMEKRKGFKAG